MKSEDKTKKAPANSADWFCLICQEPCSKSVIPWVECRNCKMQAHVSCIDDPDHFM